MSQSLWSQEIYAVNHAPSGAGSGMEAAIPIWNLVWQRNTNLLKFGQLIFRKIIKTVATRCQIWRLKCTKIDFGWGSAPDPTEGAYSTAPGPLAGFKGPTSKGKGAVQGRGGTRVGKGKKGKKEGREEESKKGREWREKGRGKKGREGDTHNANPGLLPVPLHAQKFWQNIENICNSNEHIGLKRLQVSYFKWLKLQTTTSTTIYYQAASCIQHIHLLCLLLVSK